ncbi:MAG: hypothetical protein C4B59_15505 [Candidatus Methanogaster sp.]|uniref:Uncharacterized protein n=1 Tax=Candidatus Methanogaster sp. TaxID=3386292 RepID=A0AC61KYR0_9EURY|nr:MAG: hypothetical protein C4B59_15505 [ANME-2 cluster archaeon]
MLFVRTHNAIITEKNLGKTLSKAVNTRAPDIKGITASIARLISWKQKALFKNLVIAEHYTSVSHHFHHVAGGKTIS